MYSPKRLIFLLAGQRRALVFEVKLFTIHVLFFLVGSGAHTQSPMSRIFDANVKNAFSKCTLLESRL